MAGVTPEEVRPEAGIWLRIAKLLAGWVLPYRVYCALAGLNAKVVVGSTDQPGSELLTRNSRYRGAHEGERCFILANGPSVKSQDIGRLGDEVVFSVSSGYLHASYSQIHPRYHCVPSITYANLTRDAAAEWLAEMDAKTGEAELFLSLSDLPLVVERNLFKNRSVHYLDMSESFDAWPQKGVIDISKPVPGVESVPLMCLMIAMFMGFRRIYLLGVEHDHFKSGQYRYAFEPTVTSGVDTTVDAAGKVTLSRHDDFQSLARLWRQYRRIREIATANGVYIANATAGGELDEFPRVKLEDVVARPG